MPDSAPQESGNWLVEEWARQLTRVLASMTGDSPFVTYAPHSLGDEGIDVLWWEQKFSLGPKALAWAGASERSWEEIGTRMLRSAGVDDGTKEDIRGSYVEIIRQVLSGIAGALSAKVGKEVACEDGREAPPPSPEVLAYNFEINFGDVEFSVLAVLSPDLVQHTEIKPPPCEPAVPDPAEKPRAKSTASKPNSIDLLLDVELPVSISFGRAQLPLKDVIKLTTGSIVELNRAVSEPVDVIVNNCVIARGEVVVVEGNFGVRIKQVISRQERLRTLY